MTTVRLARLGAQKYGVKWRNTHHIYRIMYHFVWIPKYRRKVFCEPYRGTLKSIIQKIGYDYDIEIVELVDEALFVKASPRRF